MVTKEEQDSPKQGSENPKTGTDATLSSNRAVPDRTVLRSLMANLPAEYRGARDRLRQLSDIFHDELAAAFQPILQAKLASMPDDSLEDKRAVATWANGEVRHLGLAFRAPTGAPARLVVDYTNGSTKQGRFRFDLGVHAGRQRRAGVYHELPPIELMEEGPRHEATSKWTDRMAHDDSKRQR